MSDTPPSILSLSFHTRFFPSLLWRRLRPKKEEYRSPFSNHVPLEFTVLVLASKVAAIAGLGAGIARGSMIGWGIGILGVVLFTLFLVGSIRSHMGARPSFDSFGFGIFFFFMVLGITVGLFEGTLLHSRSLAGWGGLAGFVAGYGAGIFAGLGIQYLGWIGGLFSHLAVAGVVGLIVLDCVLLSSLFL
ncbi:MAG: hypothetical protein ACE144_11790 [Thermodesulfobacteriota bacterium]